MDKLSELIRQKRQGISYRELGRRCGLSYVYISNIEKGMDPRSGKPIDPTISTLSKLAKGLGMELIDLLYQAGYVKK